MHTSCVYHVILSRVTLYKSSHTQGSFAKIEICKRDFIGSLQNFGPQKFLVDLGLTHKISYVAIMFVNMLDIEQLPSF